MVTSGGEFPWQLELDCEDNSFFQLTAPPPVPIGAVVPAVGTSGQFRMEMFRGEDVRDEGEIYSSDPGDYGRGLYWASCPKFASIYGNVSSGIVLLQNALHLRSAQIVTLARDVYGNTIYKGPDHCRLTAADRLTADMKAQGYDGIVVYGYESPGVWSACVFEENTK